MTMTNEAKEARLALVRERCEARKEYAQDFILEPIPQGIYILDMIQETLEEQDEIEAHMERVGAALDAALWLSALDVESYVDSLIIEDMP